MSGLLATGSRGPFPGIAGFSGERLARIDRAMCAEIEAGRIPGAALLIERQGETVLKQAWGYRDRDAGTIMTLDTIFRIYSMTKPLVSVVTMMLATEGLLTLGQPVSDFVPAFAGTKLYRDGALVAPGAPPSVQDLLRHTSGITYTGNAGAAAPFYEKADLAGRDVSNEEFAIRLAGLPFVHEPGRVWDYGHSTDLLGRVVEVAAGGWPLSAILTQRLLAPLGMYDTGFFVANEARHNHIAEPLRGDTLDGGRPLFDPRLERRFEAGGMGLVSTIGDYAKFARMLLAGGAAGKTTTLSKRTLRFMTSDHIGPSTGIVKKSDFMPGPGYGFGLGFATRLEAGAALSPGSPGEFHWTGIAGTCFWIDPAEDIFVILMTQAPSQRSRLRAMVKTMVYDALSGGRSLRV